MAAPSTYDFAARLRDALRERRISRKELAARVDVSQNTVTNWTNGRYKPGHEHLRRIAASLGMTLDELHGERVPMPASLSTSVGESAPDIDTAQRIVAALARLDIDTTLRALQAAAPNLIGLLSEARSYIAREIEPES